MKLEQTASKASEDMWIEKYRAALNLSPPEISRYARVREFIAAIYRRLLTRANPPKTVAPPIPEPKQKKAPIATPSAARVPRAGARKARRATTSGRKAAQSVDKIPSGSKSFRASNK